MIQFDSQQPITCTDCHATGYHREVVCLAPGRKPVKIAYDTHSSCEQQEHVEALQRLNTFITDMNSILVLADTMIPQIPYGKIIDINASPINPSACAVRTHFIPLVTVKAFGIEEESECPPMALSGLEIEDLMEQIKRIATLTVIQLKSQYESGNF